MRNENLTNDDPKLKGFDWRKSKAHMLLLSKFVHLENLDKFTKLDYWENVLGESPKQAIERFVDEGILIAADLNALLSYKYKVTELKDLLKQRNLPVSGSKKEMIQRLVQADHDGMKKVTAGWMIFECTKNGNEIIEQYWGTEKEKRASVEQQVVEYIKNRNFKEASLTVGAYEAEQVFPRGIGIDWKHYDPDKDMEMLNIIFESEPKILARLEDGKMETLRIGAAMMLLWGTNMAHEYLPADFETGLSLDNNTAARMFLFYASHQTTIEGYRKAGIEKVKVLAFQDSCKACKKLENKQYKLHQIPVLPYEYCTHEMGCRCTTIAVFD